MDGKTSSHNPDRGDQPVKTTQRTGNEDNMIQQGLVQDPGNMFTTRHTFGGDIQGQIDFEDEFTDDEFYPGGCTLPTRFG